MKRLISFVICIAVFFCGCETQNTASNIVAGDIPKIVLDAGHGGVDGGAVSSDGSLEKDLNLQFTMIAVDLFRLLGYNVVTTRTDDRSIHDDGCDTIREKKVSDIHNRLSIINENDIDFAISFHQNMYSQSKYRGTQVFYGRLNSFSEPLAKSVQESVKQMIQPENTRQVKKGEKSIYLLYHSEKPMILVECGFMSNYDELALIKAAEYQKKLCFAVLCGVVDCNMENENG